LSASSFASGRPAKALAQSLQDQISELERDNERLRQTAPSDSGIVALSEPAGAVQIDPSGNIQGLPSIDRADQQAALAAVTTGGLNTLADLAGLRGKPGQLMGDPRARYGLLAPLATIVAEQQPDFKWRPVEHAASYVVSIYTQDGSVAARSESLSATQWRPPANLQRGRIYTWQVRAVVDSSEVVLPPPAEPDAKFKILAASKVSELDRAKQQYSGSHLMLGVVYSRLGLLDDAERHFQALVSANPKSELARKLLQTVKSLRPKQ
jgi:hypothetical protein